ncbi:MAG: serine O-acetyltransferase [Eubacteriales bacterium]|nr:serine O-acetyltransferase [Eubacteriales bacterium]
MFATIKEDINAVRQRDPAARSTWEIITCYPCIKAIFWHRIAHWMYRRHMKYLARRISQRVRFRTGIEIHPGATIGRGLFIDHGMAVVIGETAEIGNNVTIYQGATLGGTGKHVGKRHPTIEDGVIIGAGAKILGPFRVGAHSRIGAGAVVLREVPPHSTVVGVPGRVVRSRDENGDEICLEHNKMPDPIAEEFARLYERIDALEKRLAEEETK